MIELRNFSNGYGERILLENVSASFPDGALTALTGRNGSGKSTLLRNIAGINRKYDGDVVVDGDVARRLSPPDMARRLAFVNTGRPRVANMRCEDAVAMGRAPYTGWMGRLQAEDREIVAKALADTGMSDYATRTLDTMSDGECQRVMIARALAQDTPTILLDEPTSFLDIPARRELITLLEQLAHKEGKCIIFSTHEIELALRHCDNIALIDTPEIHLMSPQKIVATGIIERVFGPC